MRLNRRLTWLVALALTVAAWPQAILAATADDKAEVRSAVQRIFNQMKSRQYDELYDSLSSSTRQRFTRQRFSSGMQRADDNYRLDRMEIGAVRVRGNTAVVDTVIYGRVLKPTEGEGKIVAQQTLVREDGQWRVSSASPGAGLSSRASRIYVKRDGRWVDITAL
ncbi:MAG TPA: hypothetical protein VEQ40_12265, partial [Pyrinomonadaceae bacterium]|nr:hypothetical protein [Pyrinomonadaceae bacterium]